jgi:hypothetical protein
MLLFKKFSLPANVSKYSLPGAKIAVSIISLFYISHTLMQRWSVMGDWFHKLSWKPSQFIILLFVVLLMPLNWGFETFKWKLLSSRLEKSDWKRSLISVLHGISFGMITPQRTGESAGRILYLKPENRLNGLIFSAISGALQLTITLCAGLLAIYFISAFITPTSGFLRDIFAFKTMYISIVALILLVLRPFLIRYLGRIKKSIFVISLLKPSDYALLLTLSLSRYITFVIQFYLLLNFLGLQIAFPLAAGLIALVYLLLALIPVTALFELGIRGSVAIFVFGLFAVHAGIENYELPVLSATLLLWIINLALPALAGSILAIHFEIRNNSAALWMKSQ